jgi:hypothetical protein
MGSKKIKTKSSVFSANSLTNPAFLGMIAPSKNAPKIK